MAYLHIPNLYKDQTILQFRECYALEKIHGTSAHISYKEGQLHLSSGGEKQARFEALFDLPGLTQKFVDLGHPEVVVFGEAYGGSQQKQSWRYGNELRFVVFDVKIGDLWLAVPQAEEVTKLLGLEFVHYVKTPTDLAALDAQRDAPSVQATRNGVQGEHPREGVVLRPLVELRMNNNERVIAKHKRDAERETATPRVVEDPAKLKVLGDALAASLEWVTPTRLEHVLQKIAPPHDMSKISEVIKAMLEDVLREGAGEIVDNKETRRAISDQAVYQYKTHLKQALVAKAEEMQNASPSR